MRTSAPIQSELITSELLAVAKEKAMRMPLGGFSRLKVNNEISDIVIRPSSSGIYFYNVPGCIMKNVSEQLIGFKYYAEIN